MSSERFVVFNRILERRIRLFQLLAIPPSSLPFPFLHFRRRSLGATGAPLSTTANSRFGMIEGTPVLTSHSRSQFDQFPIVVESVVTGLVVNHPTSGPFKSVPTKRLQQLSSFGNVHRENRVTDSLKNVNRFSCRHRKHDGTK